MKKKLVTIILALSFILSACGQKYNVSSNESQSETVKKTIIETSKETSEELQVESKLESEGATPSQDSEKRIIAASKTVAEYLSIFDQEIVGKAKQKNMPEMYEGVPEVGSPRKLNLEVIASLNPDLVVANESSKKDIDTTLKAQNIDTFYLDSSSYESIFENIKLVGEKLGKSEKANEIVEDLKNKEADLLKKAEPLRGKTVALLFGTGDNFQLMTENTYIGNLLKLIGVENIAKDSTGENNKYLPYSLENIISENPDYILTLAHGNKEQAESIFSSEFEKDLWKEMNAVKEGRLIHLDDQVYPVTGNIHVMETLDSLIDTLIEHLN